MILFRFINMFKIFFIIFMISSYAFADEIKGETKELSLSEAIVVAIKNNPSLKQLYHTKMSSEASVGMAKSDNYPSLDFNASSNLSDTKNIGGGESVSKNANVGIALNWLLYDFGATNANINATKQTLEAVNFEYNAKLSDLVFNVVDAYYYLLKTSEQVDASEINYKKSELSFEIAKNKYELGLVALNDKLQMETSYLKSEIDKNKAINDEKIAKGKLLLLLNLEPNKDIGVALPKSELEDNIDESDFLKLMENAINNRKEIASKMAEISRYKYEREALDKKDLPKISLTSDIGSGIKNLDGETKNYSGAVGLKLSVPIFTGYNSTYSKVQKQEQINRVKEELNELEASIKESVWSAYQEYKTSKLNYDVSNRLFVSAEQNEKVAFGAYQSGKGSMLNLITAQNDLIDARNEKTASLYNYLISRSKLLKEIGFLNMERFD